MAIEVENEKQVSQDLAKVHLHSLGSSIASMATALRDKRGTDFVFHLDCARSAIGQILAVQTSPSTPLNLFHNELQAFTRCLNNGQSVQLQLACLSCDHHQLTTKPHFTIRIGAGNLERQLQTQLLFQEPQDFCCPSCSTPLAVIDSYLPNIKWALLVEILGRYSEEHCLAPLQELPSSIKAFGKEFKLRGVSYNTSPMTSVPHYFALLPCRESFKKQWKIYDGLHYSPLLQTTHPKALFQKMAIQSRCSPSLAFYASSIP